jgi:4-azaleucine resistance transporter AzlC
MKPLYREFFSGVRAEFPLLIGVFPFGMIYGVLALGAGMPRLEAQAMSAIVFAGSSQLVATQLIALNVPSLVIVLTIFVVNLRHALYSASIAPHIHKLSPGWKLLLGYLLTDEAYAVAITRYADENQAQDTRHAHGFFLGAGLALWTTWQLSTAAGIFLGAVVPDTWQLDFTLALTFIAIVVPQIRDRASLAAAATAGVVVLLAADLPYKLGLVVAALVGISAGMVMEGRR